MSTCYLEKTTNKANSMFIPHLHLWFELYVLVSGTRELDIENEHYVLEENSLICIAPHYLHRFGGNSYTRYNINFSKDYLDDFQLNVISICQHQKISMTKEEAAEVFQILDRLITIQNNNTNSFKEVKARVFQSCFSYFLIVLSQLKNFPSAKYVSPNNYSLLTRQIISYLHENYSNPITLDSLAKKYNLSKRTLSGDFKKHTDMTIIDYLLNIRLNEAKRLLSLANKRKLSHIAEQCGFSSEHYFNLIFKKKFNLSPREYRNQTITRYKNTTPPPKIDKL